MTNWAVISALIDQQAAPYIFAFFESVAGAAIEVNTVDEMVEFFSKMAADQSQITQMLGVAAYAADTLNEAGIRNVRTEDFKLVARTTPHLQLFDNDEIDTISKIDPHRLSAADEMPYRPKKRQRGPVRRFAVS